jgi:hypothetical protein
LLCYFTLIGRLPRPAFVFRQAVLAWLPAFGSPSALCGWMTFVARGGDACELDEHQIRIEKAVMVIEDTLDKRLRDPPQSLKSR